VPVTLDLSIADKRWTKTIPDVSTVKGGRSHKAQIHIEDETVSSFHFQLENIPGGWVIKDLRSTNGTLVNGEKVSKIALQDDDVIKAGNCIIVFHEGLMQMEKTTEMNAPEISTQAETVIDSETE
jgi:pSer/pThr/pTyr-binding forkhead associated (FHA) protein